MFSIGLMSQLRHAYGTWLTVRHFLSKRAYGQNGHVQIGITT